MDDIIRRAAARDYQANRIDGVWKFRLNVRGCSWITVGSDEEAEQLLRVWEAADERQRTMEPSE